MIGATGALRCGGSARDRELRLRCIETRRSHRLSFQFRHFVSAVGDSHPAQVPITPSSVRPSPATLLGAPPSSLEGRFPTPLVDLIGFPCYYRADPHHRYALTRRLHCDRLSMLMQDAPSFVSGRSIALSEITCMKRRLWS